MNVVMIIPTGIGCEFGGHAGDATPVANDLLATDKVITTSAVTVARPAGTTNNLAFSYMLVGRKEA